jgi:hypothetical protein
MLTRAPNGDFVTIQTTRSSYPNPMVVQEIWDNVTQRRAPKSWEDIEPEGSLLIWWAEPEVQILCGHCHRAIGRFRSYTAEKEVGVVSVDTRRGRVTANRQTRSKDPRYHLEGECGKWARRTFARFTCRGCGHEYNLRLDRLGKRLWDDRPARYELAP